MAEPARSLDKKVVLSIFRRHSVDLYQGISSPDLPYLSWALYSERLITQSDSKAAQNRHTSDGDRATALLNSVCANLRLKPEAILKFLSILDSCTGSSLPGVAEAIRQDLGIGQPSDTSTLPRKRPRISSNEIWDNSSEGSSSVPSSPFQSSGPTVYASREVENKIDTMTFSLGQLVSCVQKLVEENYITPEEIVRCLERVYRHLPLEKKLAGSGLTMDEVFKAVREECSLLNYSILQCIALNHHLQEAHEYFTLYEQHIEIVASLLNDTDFAQQLAQAVQNMPMSRVSQMEAITIVTSWGPNRKKVQDFRDFMARAFSFLGGYIHLVNIRPGSLQFTCYAPEQLIGTATQLAKENHQVFQQFGVIQLTVGGVMVFAQLLEDPVEQKGMEQPFPPNMLSPSGLEMDGALEPGQMPSMMDVLKSIPQLVERAVQDLPQMKKLSRPSSSSIESLPSQSFMAASSNSLQPTLFSWDSLSFYLGLAMLSLVGIYILKYTAGVAFPSECVAYLICLLLRALIILQCHNSWLASMRGNAFFGLVNQVDDMRNPKTGRYRKSNFLLVRKLLKELEVQKWTLYSYIARQSILLVASLLSILANLVIFTRASETVNQDCFNGDSCFHSSNLHASTEVIHLLDNCLLLMTFVLSVCGLGWTFMGHEKQLGYLEAAEFSFASHLPPNCHVHPIPPILAINFHPRTAPIIQRLSKAFFYSPKIQNDLDFFLLVLDHSHSSKANVIREVLIEHKLQELFHQDFEAIKKMILAQAQGFVDDEIKAEMEQVSRHDTYDFRKVFWKLGMKGKLEKKLHAIFSKQLGNVELDELSTIHDLVYGATHLAFDPADSETTFALDITFDTPNFSCQLMRRFKNVVSVCYSSHYHNGDEVALYEDYGRYIKLTYPEDLYDQEARVSADAELMLFKTVCPEVSPIVSERSVFGFFLVGPLSSHSHVTTVLLLLDALYDAGFIKEGAVLLAIRPLKIEHVSKEFFEFTPAKGMFEQDTKLGNVLVKELQSPDKQSIDRVMCGTTRCQVEMKMYKFRGYHSSHRIHITD